MQTLDRRNATTITIVLAVLFGCSAIFACIGGLLALSAAVGANPPRLPVWLSGLQSICMAAAFISVPVVFYVLLLQGRSNNGPTARVPNTMDDTGNDDDGGPAAAPPARPAPAPASMADATFVEQPDDPSLKATLVSSGFDDDDDADDE